MDFLQRFREKNHERRYELFRGMCGDWITTDWGCALAGEVGELCNLLKKVRCGKHIPIEDIREEVADVFIYLDILADVLGLDLQEAVTEKFNRDSAKRGSSIFLE